MTLIVNNVTSADIVIADMGFTIPALATYDMTFSSIQSASASTDLSNAINTGNVVVDTDTLNTLSNTTGYIQIISGPQAGRPASPPPGTLRHNTDTDVVEIFQSGQWQSMPNMQNVLFGIDSYTGALCYYSPAVGKYLGVAVISLVLSNGNAADQSWLYIDNAINGAQMGYVASIVGTITNLTAYTDTPSISKSVAVWVNNTEYANTIVLGSAQNANAVLTNIDFNIGDTVRLRVNSDTAGPVGAVYVTAFFHVKGDIV